MIVSRGKEARYLGLQSIKIGPRTPFFFFSLPFPFPFLSSNRQGLTGSNTCPSGLWEKWFRAKI